MIQERNFWQVFLLNLITCGIYGIFFIYGVTKDINQMAGEDGKQTDPTLVVILWLVTCGIYPLIWYYTQGNRLQNMGRNNGVQIDENGTTYLVWTLVGSLLAGIGPLVAQYLMIQNFNRLARSYNASIYGQQNPQN